MDTEQPSPNPKPDQVLERFSRLSSDHREEARRFARLKLGAALRRRVDSEDLLQEALLEASRLYLARPELQGLEGERFVRWLGEVIRRKAMSLARHHVGAERRSVRREVRLESAKEPAGSRTPSEVAMGLEDRAALERALARLSPREREVVVLVHLEGLRVSEAAERMGKTPNSTSVLLCQALSKLESILGLSGRRKP